MAIKWQLREILNREGILNATQLKIALEDRMGIAISRVALQKLIKRQPMSLRLETAQIFSNLLQLPLETFLAITPDPIIPQPGLIQPYGRKEQNKAPLIVDPGNFL